MAQQNREHFHVHSENKAKEHEEKKKATNTIKELLINHSKRELIEIIEKEIN